MKEAEAIVAGDREAWRNTARGTLAYIIVLDQFSRNMFRGTPGMFAADELARGAGIRGGAFRGVIAFDEEGNCLAGSLMDYLIPTAMEVPDWETGHTVTPSPHHPIGAKGVGESPTVGAPPAIANAARKSIPESACSGRSSVRCMCLSNPANRIAAGVAVCEPCWR